MYVEKWNTLEKNEFLDCIKKRDFVSFQSLSCFMDFSSVRGLTARKLLEKILFDFDENNLDFQEKMYYLLDKIIDGLAQISYEKYRKFLKIRNVNEIDDIVLGCFQEANEELDSSRCFSLLRELTNNLVNDVAKDDSYFDECYRNILQLFGEYQEKGKVSKSLSIDFYNELLNRQRNYFISEEKFELISKLCNELPYSERKQKSRIVSAKLKKMNVLLKNNDYSKIGVSQDELRKSIENFAEYFSSLKDIKKEGLVITDKQVSLMNEKFLDGSLDISDIHDLCPGISVKSANIIYDKYNQVKLKYLSYVQVGEDDLPELDLGYNYNNYKIVSKDKYYDNLVKLFSNISEEDAEKILVSAESNIEIFLLVLFVDYFSTLDIKSVISILKNYSKVIDKLGVDGLDKNVFLGIPFEKLYFLSKAYESADDITIAVLGEEVVEKIVSSVGTTSKNPKDYVDIYLKMLCRGDNFIPVISGEYNNCYYESGCDSDVERLLIGKNCEYSCIGPGGAGDYTFLSCLTGCASDVILFKEKNNDDFAARCLIFRTGNYVVLAPIYGADGIENNFYNKELLLDISKKIFSAAELKNDNIEYVLLAYAENNLDEEFPLLVDAAIREEFPHADMYDKYFVIGNRNNKENVQLESSVPMLASYNRKYKSVKHGYDVTNSDYNRIRALDILMSQNTFDIEDLIKNFSFVDKNKFDDIYLGQDWYVALKDEKIAENIFLPTSRLAQEEEVLKLCKSLQNKNYSINDDDIVNILITDRGKSSHPYKR